MITVTAAPYYRDLCPRSRGITARNLPLPRHYHSFPPHYRSSYRGNRSISSSNRYRVPLYYKTLLPYTCYLTKFGRCILNSSGTGMRYPKDFEDAGALPSWDGAHGGVVTSRNMLPHLSYHADFGHSGSNCTNVINGDLPKKFDPRVPPFKVTYSLKVIGTDTDRSATYDFLLVIHNNHGPISHCVRHKRRFLSKNRNFPTPHVFNAPTEGVSLGVL